ncbi:hypothetical protein GCM10020216_089270 [Nonomuraea helvata]
MPAVVSESCAAARVTVCAVFQLDGVKVSEPPELTDRSVSPLVRVVVTVTLADGAEESLAVNVAVPPSFTATELAEVTTDGVVGFPPPQVLPFTLKLVGLGLLPVQVPLKPMETEPPVERLPLYGMLVAVTRVPDWLQLALQPVGVYFWPVVGKSKARFHDVMGSPVFFKVMFAVKPPWPGLLVHELAE